MPQQQEVWHLAQHHDRSWCALLSAFCFLLSAAASLRLSLVVFTFGSCEVAASAIYRFPSSSCSLLLLAGTRHPGGQGDKKTHFQNGRHYMMTAARALFRTNYGCCCHNHQEPQHTLLMRLARMSKLLRFAVSRCAGGQEKRLEALGQPRVRTRSSPGVAGDRAFLGTGATASQDEEGRR